MGTCGHNQHMQPTDRSEMAQKVHQLNNLLRVIQGYADLLLCDLDDGDERGEMLREIARASDFAARLIGSLRGGD